MAPLLQPAECTILLIDPRKQHISTFDLARQHGLIRAFNLIDNAASATAVPCYYALEHDASGPQELLAIPYQTATPRVHTLSNRGSSWTNSGIATALAAENRACLVVCGFWLEDSVTFMALHALSSGFDVFVLMDATPSRAEEARGPSSDRLLQAGVVPMTTHQLIAEWAEQSADLTLRSNLSRLVQFR